MSLTPARIVAELFADPDDCRDAVAGLAATDTLQRMTGRAAADRAKKD